LRSHKIARKPETSRLTEATCSRSGARVEPVSSLQVDEEGGDDGQGRNDKKIIGADLHCRGDRGVRQQRGQ